MLATPTSRARWFGAHVLLPVALTAALMALLGAAVGVVGPSVTPEAPSFGASVGAALATLPAVWVMIGVAAALAGAFPRFAPFSWGVLLVTFLATEIGPLTDLPSWLLDLSPFTHLSPLPGRVLRAGVRGRAHPVGGRARGRRTDGVPPSRRRLNGDCARGSR